MPRPTVRIVVIGDEILSGKVQDTNSPWLLRELRRHGAACSGLVVVADTIEAIAGAVAEASADADGVITSGGIGPTHDDVTMAGVAAAFDRPLQPHPLLEAFLDARWRGPRGAAWRRMASVPRGAVVEPGARFPQVRVENVWILPGVPSLFRHQWAAIADRFQAEPRRCAAVSTRQGEGELAEHLEAIVARFPRVDVGSYPRWDDPTLRVLVTLEADEELDVQIAVDALVARLDPDRLVAVDRDYHPEDAAP